MNSSASQRTWYRFAAAAFAVAAIGFIISGNFAMFSVMVALAVTFFAISTNGKTGRGDRA